MGLCSHLSSAPPSSSLSMRTFILLWCSGLFLTSVVGGNNETDRLALLEFKSKISDDPLGVMSSWNDSIHFCQWKGVSCGRRHQRVIVLDLQSQKLGSFGSVYKGILDQGRNMVAVKVLNLSRHGASKSFMAECEALRHIRHRNLVKVLTTCSGIDYQGHDFKALVYEFLGNGNLDEWLHPTPRTNEAIEEPRKLSLLQRLNIAIDVASAFDYLHHRCETPIVHCDLKPSNVLLDDDLIGHVGDFGLARFLHDVSQDCFANQSSSIGVKGTVGYTPPEYGMGNEVSVYDDIYSYDILLLEMFTGKRPTDNIFQDNLNLLDFVKAALSKRKIDIIDPNLLWEKQEEETRRINNTRNEDQNGSSKIQECLILILGIGVACSTEFPTKRMNISTVVVELHKIRESILKTIIQRQRVRTTGAQG
ncbi:probable LRR receptor-like serine/threonine-protein kinase At3g47570 isoform X2 [Quercus suber]|uniref:probable LRR receptor-like serine/threonine-protein kinase At3g47570 isoform X2 n=1 Tax=Quercus suber TaxID=58331 RepID=UPI0032DFC5FE